MTDIQRIDVRTTPVQKVVINRGPAGANGSNGTNGTNGADGIGVPTGGTTGQVLTKASNANYDTAWQTPSGGGGSSPYTLLGTTTLNGSYVYDLTLTPGKSYLFILEGITGTGGLYFRMTSGGGQSATQVAYAAIQAGSASNTYSTGGAEVSFGTVTEITYAEFFLDVAPDGKVSIRWELWQPSAAKFFRGVGVVTEAADRARFYFSGDVSVGTVKQYEVAYG